MRRCLLFVGITVLIASCSLFTDDRVNYFTVNNPDKPVQTEKFPKKINIKVLHFTSHGPYGTKMVFIESPNRVLFDNYNCWAQSPAKMLTNYFTLYLSESFASQSNSKNPRYSLYGTILNFSCDLDKKTANLSLNLELKKNSNTILLNKMYIKSVKLKSLTGVNFAAAMARAVNEVAAELTVAVNQNIK